MTARPKGSKNKPKDKSADENKATGPNMAGAGPASSSTKIPASAPPSSPTTNAAKSPLAIIDEANANSNTPISASPSASRKHHHHHEGDDDDGSAKKKTKSDHDDFHDAASTEASG